MNANPAQLLRRLRGLLPTPAKDQLTDVVLLERFAFSGDQDAFAGLVAQHGAMVLAVCRRVLHNRHDAEDVAQATFLVLARQARAIRCSASLAVWLHRTARHLALKHSRGEARRREREARHLQPSADPHPDPLDELSVHELLAICDAEIDRLPERYRLPLVLCCLEGRTHQEAAGQLGWTAGSVKGRLECGRDLLRRRLVRRGLTLPAIFVGLELMRGASSAGVPVGFVAGTLRAAVLFASPGRGSAAGLDRGVAALAETGLRSLKMSWTRVIVCLALAVGVVGAGATALSLRGWAAGPPALSPLPPRTAAAAPPVEQPVQVDRHGDPLPEGAVARLGTLRWRAAGEVEALGFWPDGKTVAAVSRAGVRLFDPDGRVTRQIPIGDTLHFDILGLSPDGKRVACGCRTWAGQNAGNRVVQIWGLAEARKVREYVLELPPGHAMPWVGWSAEGEPVVVLVTKEAVVFRELATGRDRQLESLDAINELPYVHYAPKARVLMARDLSNTYHVWDTATGKKVSTIDRKATPTLKMVISPHGSVLAALTEQGEDKRAVQILDAKTGKVRHTVAGDQKRVGNILFSPDGKTLATFGSSEVRLYDPATGREQPRLRAGSWWWRAVAFSPDGKTLASAEGHGLAIRIQDLAAGAPRATPEGHTNYPHVIDVSPDGKRVASGDHDRLIFVWDATTGQPITRFPGDNWNGYCAFSADQTMLFSPRDGDQIDAIDVRTGRTLHRLTGPDPERKGGEVSAYSMHRSGDRKNLVLVSILGGRRGGELLFTGWDTATGKQTFRRQRRLISFGWAVSPDLRVLAVSHGEALRIERGPRPGSGPIHLETLATGEHLFDLPEVQGQTSPVAFSADGRLLATCTFQYLPPEKGTPGAGKYRNTSRLWELASAQEVLAFPTTLNSAVAFSADGRLRALNSPDRAVVLYDLRQGRQLRQFRGFNTAVSCLAFSPDGRRLVSGLEDSTLLVWDSTIPKAAQPAPPDAATLNQAWADLAGDAKKAFAARGALAQWPTETVAFLKERLQPTRSADPALLRQLIAELDSEMFATRTKAQARLEELGERASAALREAIGRKPSLEARRRMEALLARQRGPIRDTETLRAVRAVAVLEDIGTPEARTVLKTLAGGLGDTRQTQEARKALERTSR
jgi:RNA polymerase sigma factor (sigma-70 family)